MTGILKMMIWDNKNVYAGFSVIQIIKQHNEIVISTRLEF